MRLPTDVAKLLILNAEVYSNQRKKEITWCVVSFATLAKFANRNSLPQTFMDQLREALVEFGWLYVDLGLGNTKFALLRLDQIENWVSISDAPLFPEGILKTADSVVEDMIGSFCVRGCSKDEAIT